MSAVSKLAPAQARPRYHQSELHTFLKCGKMWEFRYMQGVRVPPRAALTVGSAADRAVSANLDKKVTTERDISTEQVLDTFHAYDERSAKRALQPALYDFLYESVRGRPSSGFRYDVLIKPTPRIPPRTQQVHAKIDQDDRNWMFGTIGQVHKAIQAGVAMPAPEGSWYCSREWCVYCDRCKGKGRK